MATVTIQGASVFQRLINEDQECFSRRMGFYDTCTQWLNQLERVMLSKNILGGLDSLSMRFSVSDWAIVEFKWRNFTYCLLHFSPKTGEIYTPFIGPAKLRIEALKKENPINGVKLLSGCLYEVVKNEITKLEQLKDAFASEARIIG